MTYSPLDLVEGYLRRFVAYPSEHALVAHYAVDCPHAFDGLLGINAPHRLQFTRTWIGKNPRA